MLITATEETGMDGANGLKPGLLKGDILLNLDSETEGELYVGCAGGLDSTIEFNYQEEAVPADVKAFRIGIKGLKGGHSGWTSTWDAVIPTVVIPFPENLCPGAGDPCFYHQRW